jgi:chromosome segregation ATPase
MKKFTTIAITAVIAVLPFVAIWQRQELFDWWRLRNYQPTAQIASLANDTTMTDDGRHLFYVYHAVLQDSEAFNQSCEFGEQSIVLGCYVSGQGIYIYNVTDERLAGIQEVTAAHEVLHAGYERLSSEERERIDELTLAEYTKLNDKRIKDAVEAYRKRDPSIVPNELHSIIGTEVRDISSELENYYARYFENRKSIVAYSEHYEQAFIEQKEKATALEKEIKKVRDQINSLDAQLRETKAKLEQQYASLQADRAQAEPSSYNARVRSYNSEVQSYNSGVKTSYQLIDQHNELVKQYNLVVSEEKELIEAIDSRPETINQQ